MIAYKYKLYQTKRTKHLDAMLREASFVWNHALSQSEEVSDKFLAVSLSEPGDLRLAEIRQNGVGQQPVVIRCRTLFHHSAFIGQPFPGQLPERHNLIH